MSITSPGSVTWLSYRLSFFKALSPLLPLDIIQTQMNNRTWLVFGFEGYS